VVGLLMTKKRTLIFFGLIIPLLLTACQVKTPTPSYKEYSGFAMGGVIQYKLYGNEENTTAAFTEISQLFLDLDQEFSANREDSNLSLINAQASSQPIAISQAMLEVLQLSLEIEQASQGAFNPVIGPLVKLWKIGFEAAHVPTDGEIQLTLPLMNSKDMVLGNDPLQISFLKPGMGLDLGSVVKGYAAELAMNLCQEYELHGALISVNGNLAIYGQRPEGALWNVGIVDPRGENGEVVGSIALENITVATSGDYERYFEVEGVRYHHLLDSKTGYPAETDLISVSIFSPDGALADALSTATFILGHQQGEALLKNYDEIDYLLIDQNFKLWASPAIRDQFHLTAKNYQWGIE
jgi:thiamine biosynthesis lipoprotein